MLGSKLNHVSKRIHKYISLQITHYKCQHAITGPNISQDLQSHKASPGYDDSVQNNPDIFNS